jgi:phosphoserine phosphatase
VAAQFPDAPFWALEILERQEQIMASIANVLAADAQLKGDVSALSGLVTQLIQALAAAAAGTVTPAQLQQLLTDLQSEDTTVASASAAIQSALGISPTPAPTT